MAFLRIVRSAIIWAINLIWLIFALLFLMVIQCIWPADRLGFLTRLYCRVQLRLTGSRVSYRVSPKISNSETYFFCQNHVNLLDHVTVYNSTPHFKQGIELNSHFRIPVYGWFMKQRGTIGVGKQRNNFKRLANQITTEITNQHSLLFFPEGGRTLDGQLKPFRPGIFKIAEDLDIAIVPVVVDGMFDVLKKGDWHIYPFKRVTVTLLDPIYLKDINAPSLNGKIEIVRDLMVQTLSTTKGEGVHVSGSA